jgi:cysteine synthase
LMVLGLWLIIARTRGNVGIGMVVVVWLRQGKRKIMMPKKKYKEEEKSKS